MLEEDFRKRKAHPNFKDHLEVEKNVIKIGKKAGLKTYVISSGLVYHGGLSIFHFFLKVRPQSPNDNLMRNSPLTSWHGKEPKSFLSLEKGIMFYQPSIYMILHRSFFMSLRANLKFITLSLLMSQSLLWEILSR